MRKLREYHKRMDRLKPDDRKCPIQISPKCTGEVLLRKRAWVNNPELGMICRKCHFFLKKHNA